jgi:hypothetical protein
MFYYSRDRKGEHPQRHLAGYGGIFQADAFDGYRQLYAPDRSPGRIIEAGCWVHARRPFFAMADLDENTRRKATGKKEILLSPIALEIVRRIDAPLKIERTINGKMPDERREVRQSLSKPLTDELLLYMREQRAKLSRGHDLAKAIDYIVKRWDAFTLFLNDGRVCLSNNAAERALRGIALGQKLWMFCGSDRGGQRAAAMYSLIVSALCRPPNYAERFRNNARLSRYSRLSRDCWVRSIRHSLVAQSASRKASNRSLGRNRVRLPPWYGVSLANAASFSARCACR